MEVEQQNSWNWLRRPFHSVFYKIDCSYPDFWKFAGTWNIRNQLAWFQGKSRKFFQQ